MENRAPGTGLRAVVLDGPDALAAEIHGEHLERVGPGVVAGVQYVAVRELGELIGAWHGGMEAGQRVDDGDLRREASAEEEEAVAARERRVQLRPRAIRHRRLRHVGRRDGHEVRPVPPAPCGPRQPGRAAGEAELPRIHLPAVEALAVGTAHRLAADLGGVVGNGVAPVPRHRGAADDGDGVQVEEDVDEAVRRERGPRRRHDD